MEWCVYILLCADGTYYTGSTNNLSARIDAHNSKKGAKYTRSRLPVKLAAAIPCQSKSDALKTEAGIKKLSRKQKTELISLQNKE